MNPVAFVATRHPADFCKVLPLVVLLDQVRVSFSKFRNLRTDRELAVRLPFIQFIVVLVEVFRRIPLCQFFQSGDDGVVIRAFLVDPGDHVFCRLLLLLVGKKDGGTVLSANVGALAIQRRWIVCVEKNIQKLIV